MSSVSKAFEQLDKASFDQEKSKAKMRADAIGCICASATGIDGKDHSDRIVAAIEAGSLTREEAEKFHEIAAEVKELLPLAENAPRLARECAQIVESESKRRQQLFAEMQECARKINQAEIDRGGVFGPVERLRELSRDYPEVGEVLIHAPINESKRVREIEPVPEAPIEDQSAVDAGAPKVVQEIRKFETEEKSFIG